MVFFSYTCIILSRAENRVEFLEKLQRVCAQVPGGAQSVPILSTSGPSRLVVGNWSLICQREGEVAIHNSDGNRVSIHHEGERGKEREVLKNVRRKCAKMLILTSSCYNTVLNLILRMEKNSFNFEKHAFFW